MTLTAAIVSLLLSLPVASVDRAEDPRVREARLREVAASVSSAVQHATCSGAWSTSGDCRRIWGGEQTELASIVLAVAWHESHLAAYVQEDRCHDGPAGQRCDSDRHGNPRARSLWQLWAVAAPEVHSLPLGDPRTTRVAAWRATQLLVGAIRFCRDDGGIRGAFGRYSGRRCSWPGGVKREATARRFRWSLLRAMAAGDTGDRPRPAEPSVPQ